MNPCRRCGPHDEAGGRAARLRPPAIVGNSYRENPTSFRPRLAATPAAEPDTAPEVGTPVELQFQIPGSVDPIEVTGVVVRVTEGDAETGPGMGIEFEDLDAQARQHINELVRKLRADITG